jgi:hypothetical protein
LVSFVGWLVGWFVSLVGWLVINSGCHWVSDNAVTSRSGILVCVRACVRACFLRIPTGARDF